MRALMLIAAAATAASCSRPVAPPGSSVAAGPSPAASPGPPQTCVIDQPGGEPARARPADPRLRLRARPSTSTGSPPPARRISQFNTIIVERGTGGQYCRGDRVRGLEPGAIIPGPVVQPRRLGPVPPALNAAFQSRSETP